MRAHLAATDDDDDDDDNERDDDREKAQAHLGRNVGETDNVRHRRDDEHKRLGKRHSSRRRHESGKRLLSDESRRRRAAAKPAAPLPPIGQAENYDLVPSEAAGGKNGSVSADLPGGYDRMTVPKSDNESGGAERSTEKYDLIPTDGALEAMELPETCKFGFVVLICCGFVCFYFLLY